MATVDHPDAYELQALLRRVRSRGQEIRRRRQRFVRGALLTLALVVVGAPVALGISHIQPTGSANDRAAQSDLTNALTEASAVYQSESGRFPTNAAVLLKVLQQMAPEFEWSSGACAANSGTCVSFVVIAGTDGQSIELASYARNNGQCWYALQNNAPLPPSAPIARSARSGGAYYGRTRHRSSCAAGAPEDPAMPASGWYSSYSSVP